jgi:cyclophilin family peptidyl-prolyl cis-trans isomerase
MPVLRIAFLTLLMAALSIPTAALRRAAAGEPGPTAALNKALNKKGERDKSATSLTSRELRKKWADLLARRERIIKATSQLQQEVEAAKGLEARQKVFERFEPFRREFETDVQPGLNQYAADIHKLDPADPISGDILIGNFLPQERGMVVPDTNYLEAVTILKGLTRRDKDSQAIVEKNILLMIEDWRHADVAPVVDKLTAAKDPSPTILTLGAMVHLFSSDFEGAVNLIQRAVKTGATSPQTAAFAKTCVDYIGYWKREQEIRAAETQADDLPRVALKTSKGEIVVELFENEAPNTVASFISLTEASRYDGTSFHRVIPGFMAQGGDPNTLDDDPSNDGQGGPGYTIPCECYSDEARMHFQGSLSMAHSGKDSGGSQFFITHAPTPHLNSDPNKQRGSSHTVFGRVIKGLDVALAVRTGDKIESAKVLRKRDHAYVPKTKPDQSSR